MADLPCSFEATFDAGYVLRSTIMCWCVSTYMLAWSGVLSVLQSEFTQVYTQLNFKWYTQAVSYCVMNLGRTPALCCALIRLEICMNPCSPLVRLQHWLSQWVVRDLVLGGLGLLAQPLRSWVLGSGLHLGWQSGYRSLALTALHAQRPSEFFSFPEHFLLDVLCPAQIYLISGGCCPLILLLYRNLCIRES